MGDRVLIPGLTVGSAGNPAAGLRPDPPIAAATGTDVVPVGELDLAALARRVAESEPRLGAVRLICIDGPAGAGKTSLAGRVAAHLQAPVVHLDDLYPGWNGLGRVWPRLQAGVLEPFAQRRPGSFQAYDWVADRFAAWHQLPWADRLVVEGCGAAQRAADDIAVLRVWIEAPREVRLRRGLQRDGAALREHWLHWMEREEEHFRAEGTRSRADIRLDGSGVDLSCPTAPGSTPPGPEPVG